jgi:hypothetical protein
MEIRFSSFHAEYVTLLETYDTLLSNCFGDEYVVGLVLISGMSHLSK